MRKHKLANASFPPIPTLSQKNTSAYSSFTVPRHRTLPTRRHKKKPPPTPPPQFRAIDVKKFRESEIKHARIAMLAFLGMFVQELAHPLFQNGGKDLGPAIYHFQAVENYFALMPAILLVIVGIMEGNNIYGASLLLLHEHKGIDLPTNKIMRPHFSGTLNPCRATCSPVLGNELIGI